MSVDAGTQDRGAVVNPPFANPIAWRVANRNIDPSHLARMTIVVDGVVSGQSNYRAPEQDSLTLMASINGRERREDMQVSRRVLDAVTPAGTFHTAGSRYVWRFALWLLIWTVSFVFAWPMVESLVLLLYSILLGVLLLAPPVFSKSIIDIAWWSGHGFRNEPRARWAIASVMWVLAAGTLVLLQIRVS